MSEFTIRSESVDVEQIMKQIRQRILEKRGQDYTEEQIRDRPYVWHPIARRHPKSGRTALYMGRWAVDIEGMPKDEGRALIDSLLAHVTQRQFVYTHRWRPNELVMWDNRCLVHAATGGYEGHRRFLHRVTIAEKAKTSQ